MERVALFLDHANLEGAFRQLGTRVDYVGLRDYLSDGRFLVEVFVYVPIHPDRQDRMQRFIEALQERGFFVRPKLGKRAGDGWKCNVDIEMTIDILRYVHQSKVDIVVIGAGDGDLVPVVHEVRYSGIRCEVASTPATAARELVLSANGFVDLGVIIREGFDQLNPSLVDPPEVPPFVENGA